MDKNKECLVVLYQPKDMDSLLAKVVNNDYLNREVIYGGKIRGMKRIIHTGEKEECISVCQGYNYGVKFQSNTDKIVR